MSWYDEDGNSPFDCKTNAQDGVSCEGCDENIADCEGCKLWLYDNRYLCKECLIETVMDSLPVIKADEPSIYF